MIYPILTSLETAIPGRGSIGPKAKLAIVATTAVVAVALVVVGIASLKPKSEPESVNKAPVASFLYDADNLTVDFDASTSSDSDGSIVHYSWTFGDGEEKNSSAPVVTYEYAANGSYSVKLTVTDNGNAKNSTEKKVNVKIEEVPRRPVAEIEVVNIDNLTVQLSGAESEAFDGRTIVNYSWSFGDGGEAFGVEVTHTFAANGTYEVNLTVTDSEDLNDSDSKDVTVSKEITPTHKTPRAGIGIVEIDELTVTVSGESSKAFDGYSIVNYSWTLGDGSMAYGAKVTHTYAANGTYKVNLTVTDSAGLTDTTSVTVKVSTGPPEPPSEKEGPPGLYRAIEVHEQLLEKNPKLQNSLSHLKDNLARWIANHVPSEMP
ncbi:MAG TPA: PKD domain-containing protein [Thermoplasmata archaeon]